MSYLILFLLIAFAGIGGLWVHQKRQRASIDSVDGFRASLERLSGHNVAIPDRDDQDVVVLDRHDEDHALSGSPSSTRRPEPLDPVRREAARRRLRARRAPGTTQ